MDSNALNGLFGSVWNHKRLLSKTDLSPWSVGISLSHRQCKAVGRTWNYGCGSHPESRVKAHVPWATPRSLARNMLHPHYLHQWYWGKNPHNLQANNSSPIISKYMVGYIYITIVIIHPIISNNQYCHGSFFVLSHMVSVISCISGGAKASASPEAARPATSCCPCLAGANLNIMIMMGVFR